MEKEVGRQQDEDLKTAISKNNSQTDSTIRTFRISIFRNKTDVEPVVKIVNWDDLARRLTRHDQRNAKDGLLWCPGTFKPGTTRAKLNVDNLSLAVLDFDSGVGPREYIRTWKVSGYAYIVHSTYSSTPESPRWRAILALSRQVRAEEWPQVWGAIRTAYGAEATDPSCKDASRIYYLPACPPDAVTFGYSSSGRPIDVDSLTLTTVEGANEPLRKPPPARMGNGLHISDSDLLSKMLRSKHGDEIAALYNGNWQGLKPSQSEADAALYTHLYWWTGRDEARAEAMFRASGLNRDKWDREDYRARIVEWAHEHVAGGYEVNGCASYSLSETQVVRPKAPDLSVEEWEKQGCELARERTKREDEFRWNAGAWYNAKVREMDYGARHAFVQKCFGKPLARQIRNWASTLSAWRNRPSSVPFWVCQELGGQPAEVREAKLVEWRRAPCNREQLREQLGTTRPKRPSRGWKAVAERFDIKLADEIMAAAELLGVSKVRGAIRDLIRNLTSFVGDEPPSDRRTCRSCRGTRFWRYPPDQTLVCGRCHPPARPNEAEWPSIQN